MGNARPHTSVRRLPLALIAGLLLLAAGLALEWRAAPRHDIKRNALKNAKGMPFQVLTYFPEPPPETKLPAVVLCQPLNNPPAFCRSLALELVKRGFAVLTFDWRGDTPEENRQLLKTGLREIGHLDVLAAVAFLSDHLYVDPARIFLAGHSIGASFAFEAAMENSDIRGLAMIGMEADVPPDHPSNVLWAVGLYDEFRPVPAMRRRMAASADGSGGEGVTVGDFADGTARRLAVSPTADHFIELQDPGVQRAVIDWFLAAAGEERNTGALLIERARGLYFAGWLLTLGTSLALLRRLSGGRRSRARLIPVCALLLTCGFGLAAKDGFTLMGDAMLFATLTGLLGGYVAVAEEEAFRKVLGLATRFAVVLWAAICLTLLLNSLPVIAAAPKYLISFPEFTLTYPITLLKNYVFLDARQFLFSPAQLLGARCVLPTAGVFVLLAIEVCRPGLPLGFAASIPARLGKAPANKKASGKSTAAGLAAFGILMAILGMILWTRFQQGFLTGESALAALLFIFRYGVATMFIFLLLWKLRGTAKSPTGKRDLP